MRSARRRFREHAQIPSDSVPALREIRCECTAAAACVRRRAKNVFEGNAQSKLDFAHALRRAPLRRWPRPSRRRIRDRRAQPARGPRQRDPAHAPTRRSASSFAGCSKQQLGAAAARRRRPSRRAANDARLVEHQQVAGFQECREIGEAAMLRRVAFERPSNGWRRAPPPAAARSALAADRSRRRRSAAHRS